jgi:hypothetical protein
MHCFHPQQKPSKARKPPNDGYEIASLAKDGGNDEYSLASGDVRTENGGATRQGSNNAYELAQGFKHEGEAEYNRLHLKDGSQNAVSGGGVKVGARGHVHYDHVHDPATLNPDSDYNCLEHARSREQQRVETDEYSHLHG